MNPKTHKWVCLKIISPDSTLILQCFTAYWSQQPPRLRESSPSVWKRLLSGDQIRPSSQWNNGSHRVVKFICRTRSDPASVKGKDAAGVRTLDSGLSLDAICAVDKAPGIQGSGTVAEHTVYWMVEANWFFSRFMRWPRLTGLTVPDNKRILHLCTIRYWNESVTSAVVVCIIQGLHSCTLSVSTLRLHLSPNSNHIIRIPLNDSGVFFPSIFPIILLETLKSPHTLD